MKKTNYRLFLLLAWTACYIIILLCYIAAQRPDTDKLPRVLELFGATSAVILPQLTIMFTFFFEKSEDEVRSIISHKPNSKLAYWFSFSYILIYTVLIIIGIPFDKISLFGWTRDECTYYLILIMGHLSLLSTVPTAYLFKTETTHGNEK